MNIYKKYIALLGTAILLSATPAVAQIEGVQRRQRTQFAISQSEVEATAAGAAGTKGYSVPGNVTSSAVWQVDSRHSIAELTTDGTSDYGKTKIDVPLGIGRLDGVITIDEDDPEKSNVSLQFYPASP